jgi:cytochrome b
MEAPPSVAGMDGSDGRAASSERIAYIWDVPTRLFHWLLVASVAVALVTGLVAPESWMNVHLAAGYFILTLLAFRLSWGFFGPEHARLSRLARKSVKFADHLRGLVLLRAPDHHGHNPAGSAMILALIGVLAGLVATGLLVEGGEEKQGPLAGVASYALGSGAKAAHAVLAWLLIAMITAHVIGVLVESRLQRAPLVRAMVTGWIPLPSGWKTPRAPRATHPILALTTMAVLIGGGALSFAALSRLPPLGVPVMPVNQAWVDECGECHQPFHPSLLPRASWRTLMAELEDHFGEDASPPEATATAIATFLDTYAAEAWDTEAAHRLSNVSPGEPSRITATPYWVAKHSGLDPALFRQTSVRSRSNCGACHRDAATGRFDDQAIRPPDPTSRGGTP